MSSRSIIGMVLAYLVPGAGHLYVGQRAKAAVFFVIVTMLFVIGLSIDGTIYTFGQSGGALLRLLAAAGSVGSGLLYWIANAMGPHGDITSITYEYGTTFTLTAGLMNLLLVLDVYDITIGRKS